MGGGVGVEHDGRGTGVGTSTKDSLESRYLECHSRASDVLLQRQDSLFSHGLMPEGPSNTGPDNQARGGGVMTTHGSGQVPSIPDNE